MAASAVDICNQALLMLGAKPITNFTEATTRAQLCATHYPQIRDSVLRAHPWNCAIARSAALAPEATAPTFGWNYSFVQPIDPLCLRVLELDPEESDWVVEGNKILTDENPIKIKYIFQLTDVTKMDSLLVAAIAARLAAELAYAITEHAGLAEVMMKVYQDKLGEARSIDGQEGAVVFADSRDLLDVRLPGFRNDWRQIRVVP